MKKLVSVFLAIIMLFSCASVGVFAVNAPKQGEMWLGSAELTHFDPSVAVDTSNLPVTSSKFFSSGADDMYNFYTYLNSAQKDVYNAILNTGIATGTTVTLSPAIECDAGVDSNNYLVIPDETKSAVYAAVVGGISAVCDDHPEIFWINGFGYSMSYSYSSNGDGTYHLYINKLNITYTLNTSAYADISVVQNYYSRMMAAVDAFKVNGDTRYERLKSIHDQIVKSVQYDSTFTCSTAHDPTSVFLDPYTPVCEGYAEALKILCNRENIPCVVVVGDANGGGHAWNYVKMEDNKWYAVDMTWDDPVGNSADGVFYDYFLVGSQATNRYFGNDTTTFENDHTPTGQRYSTSLFSLTYPTLNATSYSPMLINRNSGATVKKAEKLVFIEKDGVFSTSFVAPYGYSIATSGLTTGGTLTVTKASTVTDTYTLVRRGDVNASNTVTSADTDILRKAANANYKLQSGTANYYAADMNGDGAVDAYDAIAHDLYVNDMLKYN
ncbi:MAG: transglutaminase domain-containing protein [Candidatus Fimenecus sp.]